MSIAASIGNVVPDTDDFTYTEDEIGQQRRVPVQKEFVFKVVVLGNYSVGKTSLVKRLLRVQRLAPANGDEDDLLSDIEDSGDDADDADFLSVRPTVGTDFYSLALPDVLPGVSVRLQIWDTAGLEKYAANYDNTFRNVSFVMCVFDVTSETSLHDVVDRHLTIAAEHIPELDQSNIMVVANKIDIVGDLANHTQELKEAQKRARSPETAFASTIDEDTATNTDIFTSAKSVLPDAIVSAKKVQADVFDLFGDVHYAEVSAKTRNHVRSMLQTMVYALLRNNAEASMMTTVPAAENTYDIFARTVLPMQTPCSSPVRTRGEGSGAGALMAPTKSSTMQDPVGEGHPNERKKRRNTAAPPPPSSASNQSTDAEKVSIPSLSPPAAQGITLTPPPSKPAASWGTTGAFNFDIKPANFSSTVIYSPMEKMDEYADGGPTSAHPSEFPSERSTTQMMPESKYSSRAPRLTPISPVETGPEAVVLTLGPAKQNAATSAAAASPRPRIDPNETPQARKEREQAEMGALLGRAKQQRRAQPVADYNPAGDVDQLEGNVAADKHNTARTPPQPRMSSILDSLGVQEAEKKRKEHGGQEEEEGEDGAQLQARIRNRFAQIEHDVHQDAAATRKGNRARTQSTNKLAHGKCHMCVLM